MPDHLSKTKLMWAKLGLEWASRPQSTNVSDLRAARPVPPTTITTSSFLNSGHLGEDLSAMPPEYQSHVLSDPQLMHVNFGLGNLKFTVDQRLAALEASPSPSASVEMMRNWAKYHAKAPPSQRIENTSKEYKSDPFATPSWRRDLDYSAHRARFDNLMMSGNRKDVENQFPVSYGPKPIPEEAKWLKSIPKPTPLGLPDTKMPSTRPVNNQPRLAPTMTGDK